MSVIVTKHIERSLQFPFGLRQRTLTSSEKKYTNSDSKMDILVLRLDPKRDVVDPSAGGRFIIYCDALEVILCATKLFKCINWLPLCTVQNMSTQLELSSEIHASKDGF